MNTIDVTSINTIDDIYNLFKNHSKREDEEYILSLKDNTNIVKCLQDRCRIRARYYPECKLYFHRRINAIRCIHYIISNNIMNYTNICNMYTSKNKYNKYMVFEYYFNIMVEQLRNELNSYEYEGFEWMKKQSAQLMPVKENNDILSADSKYITSLIQMVRLLDILTKSNVHEYTLPTVIMIFINRVLSNMSIAVVNSDFRMAFLYFLQKVENSRVFSENECIKNKVNECKTLLAYICVHDMYEW
jgi:hypothetical protein